MRWEIEYTDQFEQWWVTLAIEQQRAISAAVNLLGEAGPGLGRPAVDTIVASRHSQMKELRTGSTRILFAFDKRRFAILLLGGDKSGHWNQWYRAAIPLADDLFDAHLHDLRNEGPV